MTCAQARSRLFSVHWSGLTDEMVKQEIKNSHAA